MRRLLVPLLAVVVVAGCGGDDSTAPQDVSSTTSAPTSTALADVRDIPASEVALEPGEYTFSQFEPALTFRVDEGWETGHRRYDFFDVWRGREIAIGWARPEFVNGSDGPVATDGLAPADAIEALAANPAVVDAARPREAAVGGVSGTALELQTRPGGELFGSADGAFQTAPGSVRFRVTALSVSEELLLMLEISAAPPHAAHFSVTDLVADTVEFGE